MPELLTPANYILLIDIVKTLVIHISSPGIPRTRNPESSGSANQRIAEPNTFYLLSFFHRITSTNKLQQLLLRMMCISDSDNFSPYTQFHVLIAQIISALERT